jgi:FtsX-like permease family/Aspartyl protease
MAHSTTCSVAMVVSALVCGVPLRSAETIAEVPFELYQRHLVVTKGSIGRLKGLNLLIDTGTIPSTVDTRIARKLHLKAESSTLVAFGQQVRTQSAVIDGFGIGSLQSGRVPAGVSDLSYLERVRIDAIVGLDVLARTSFTINYRTRVLRFAPTDREDSVAHPPGIDGVLGVLALGCLLIACVNLTNLVAARAMARRREVAVRVAIGASRGRIMRQFLAEGVVLCALGAVGGVFVALALIGAAAAVMPEPDVFFRSAVAPGTPQIAGASGLTRIGASMISLDAMTLAFIAGVALLTAMLVSLLPAAQASLLRPVDALKKGKAEGGARWLDARGVLVTAPIALALILLAGAGLMIRSAERLRETGIGVDPTGLFTVRIDLAGAAYDSNRGQQFYAQLLERVSALPGVRSAALGLCAPVSGGCNGTIAWFPPAREPFRDGRDPSVGIHWITPGLLDTLGVKLLRGRNITDQDRAGQPKVLLVSETAARRMWPNDEPIGKRMWAGQGSAGSRTSSEIRPLGDFASLELVSPWLH